jgi:sec-independent protein translocase protein TatA
MKPDGRCEKPQEGCVKDLQGHILYTYLVDREQSGRRSHRAGVAGGFMFGFGIGELLVVLVIVLVLFGRRLPDLGEGLGKSIKKFRKAMNDSDEVDVTPKKNSGDS